MSSAAHAAHHLGGGNTQTTEMPASDSLHERRHLPPLPSKVRADIKCPSCKSPKIRYSASPSPVDEIVGVFGWKALRCHSCYAKFRKFGV